MTLPDVTIRPAQPHEAEALTAIALAAKRHWGYPEARIELWRSDLTFTAAYIESRPVYAADLAGAIVGAYALAPCEQGTEIDHFWVLPQFMGQGIGRLLFRHAAETARRGGATALRIVSDPYAEGFYRRMGAQRIGTVPSTLAGRVLPVLRCDL